MYAIIRTSDGLYVTKPGSQRSYTNKLERARTWPTREQAEIDRCPENERIVDVLLLLNRRLQDT